MKVLIVDDEQHVRDAIRLLVDWERFGIAEILEASDGEAAIRLTVEHEPEIVFTDMMMPGINGIQLLEWLHANAPRIKTVVISGHDDFEFVRNTVKYGGMDYLLKPIDPAELEEAVRKAAEARSQEDQALRHSQQRNIEMNQIKPVYWDKMFSQLVSEPTYYETIAGSLQQEFGHSREHTACRIAILSLDQMDGSIRDKFTSSTDLLFFSLLNICNEYMRKKNAGYAFRYWNSASDIVLLFWREPESVERLLNEINAGISGALKSKFDFGLGTILPFPGGLTQSFAEASAALRQRNLLQRDSWIHTYGPKNAPGAAAVHLSDFEEPIRLALLSGSEEHVRTAMSDWFDAVRKLPCVNAEQLELWRHEYQLLKARCSKALATEDSGGAWPDSQEVPIAALPLDPTGRLSLDSLLEDMTQDLLGLLQHAALQRKDNHLMAEIAKYVQAHYHHELTLQDIANRFFVSREYISRKFKQELGENLSDYIERIRIDKAKLLLQSPHLRIAQISEMVGYHDEKYFSKVFKKAVGSSPGEYRKQQL